MRDARGGEGHGGDAPLTPGDAEFLERVARPLRAPERLGDTFTERVMAGVQVTMRETPVAAAVAFRPVRQGVGKGGWWSRPRTLHVSPLGALAVAAGVAGVAFIGAVTLRSVPGGRAHPATSVAAGPVISAGSGTAATSSAPTIDPTRVIHDTVHVVRFVLVAPGARRVTLVGDFNAWSKEATPLAATSRPGVWSVSMPLPPGRHEYAFIVQQGDRTRWVTDPAAATAHDDFGTESSVVTVGRADSSEAGHTS